MDKSKYLLEVKDLKKVYKDIGQDVIALDSISFNLKYGEDLAILGPSGSGKTTLLQLAGGLDKPTSGSVFVDGVDIKKLDDKKLSAFRNKRMGFVFQMINLHDFFTAKENVMLPLLLAGTNRKVAEQKAFEILEKMGLEERANHLPKQLSGGEQQRVAVARALANDPQIIFADEPTGKLDKDNSAKIIDLLEEIAHERGTSVVMITHDQSIAKRFSRVLKMESGKIIDDTKFRTNSE